MWKPEQLMVHSLSCNFSIFVSLTHQSWELCGDAGLRQLSRTSLQNQKINIPHGLDDQTCKKVPLLLPIFCKYYRAGSWRRKSWACQWRSKMDTAAIHSLQLPSQTVHSPSALACSTRSPTAQGCHFWPRGEKRSDSIDRIRTPSNTSLYHMYKKLSYSFLCKIASTNNMTHALFVKYTKGQMSLASE